MQCRSQTMTCPSRRLPRSPLAETGALGRQPQSCRHRWPLATPLSCPQSPLLTRTCWPWQSHQSTGSQSCLYHCDQACAGGCGGDSGDGDAGVGHGAGDAVAGAAAAACQPGHCLQSLEEAQWEETWAQPPRAARHPAVPLPEPQQHGLQQRLQLPRGRALAW